MQHLSSSQLLPAFLSHQECHGSFHWHVDLTVVFCIDTIRCIRRWFASNTGGPGSLHRVGVDGGRNRRPDAEGVETTLGPHPEVPGHSK